MGLEHLEQSINGEREALEIYRSSTLPIAFNFSILCCSWISLHSRPDRDSFSRLVSAPDPSEVSKQAPWPIANPTF